MRESLRFVSFKLWGVISQVEVRMPTSLQKHQHKFTHLRQGVTKYGPAPHKPVLLLAVTDGFERGWITENRIDLSPELVGRFKSIWNQLVTTDHCPLIVQPFFYMHSEKFWLFTDFYGTRLSSGVFRRTCRSIFGA